MAAVSVRTTLHRASSRPAWRSARPGRAVAWLVAFALAAFAPLGTARADGFNCGNRIVTEGMEQYQVRDVCGEPAQVTRTTILRRPVVWIRGRPYYASAEEVPVPVETWLYDFGPQRLMRKLRFEDGVLTNVETLGYGTNR